MQAARPAQKAEKSIKTITRDQMAKGMLPSDMGLLQDTFVTPLKFPSIFRSPREFFKLQYFRTRLHLRDLLSLFAMKISSPRGKRWWNRALHLNRSKISPVAVDLHQKMYTAFADGDIPKLKEICTDGVFDSMRARIGGRQRTERVKWELLRYNGSSKVVSDRMAQIPGGAGGGNALRQAVVRIRSTQKLSRAVGGRLVEGSGREKDVVEYVVLQCRFEKWAPQEWRVWGTTMETSLKDVEKWQRAAKE